MARREWPLRFMCGHPGCPESANYRYQTKRDMMESFELKQYSNGRWLCTRHSRPDELLSLENRETRAELIVEEKAHGRYFGHTGFVSGPGFRAFAKDFPAGTKIIVTTELVLPASGIDARQGGDACGSVHESPVDESRDAQIPGEGPQP